MTEELYYKNQYETEFNAKVVACEKIDADKYAITLDRTAFFPEQGGQYADVGTIDGADVLDVQKKDGEIIHILPKELAIGSEVKGNVNFEKRFDRMQNHTGEHIVCGIIHNIFGYDNVGFHLSDDELTMDTSGELSEEDIAKVEALANEIVFKNLPITILYPNPEELSDIEYRAKLDLKENVRLVKIGDIDICACCAPHVNFTGEVGLIKVIKSMRWKGGMRLNLACGKRAYIDYAEKHNQIKKISQITNKKPGEVTFAVSELSEKLNDAKKEIAELKLDIIKNKIDALPKNTENIFLEIMGDMDTLRESVNYGMEKTNGIVLAYAGDNENGYTFVLSSKTKNIAEFSKDFFKSLNARGGGRDNMISGKIMNTKENIENYFACLSK